MALVTDEKWKLKQSLLQQQQRNSLEIETWHTNVAGSMEFSNKRKGELQQEPMPYSQVPWQYWENQATDSSCNRWEEET